METLWRGDIASVRLVVPPPTALRAADHYRARAAYCVEVAECMTDPEIQSLCFALAWYFEQVAEEAEVLEGGALLN
jgi:hypothetical protein